MTRSEVVKTLGDRLEAALGAAIARGSAQGADSSEPDEGAAGKRRDSGSDGPVSRSAQRKSSGETLQLSDYNTSGLCPHQTYNVIEEYRPTTYTSARRIGLAALIDEYATGEPRADVSPAARIARILDDPDCLDLDLADWVAGLAPPALAMVQQSSTAWMVDTLALAARQGEPEWLAKKMSWRIKAHNIRLSAGVDARRTYESHVFLYRTQPSPRPTDARLAGRLALLHGLTSGYVPDGVILGYRRTLTRSRFDLDVAAVDTSIADVVEDYERARNPSEAPTVPGTYCGYCALQQECEVGISYLRVRRRST